MNELPNSNEFTSGWTSHPNASHGFGLFIYTPLLSIHYTSHYPQLFTVQPCSGPHDVISITSQYNCLLFLSSTFCQNFSIGFLNDIGLIFSRFVHFFHKVRMTHPDLHRYPNLHCVSSLSFNECLKLFSIFLEYDSS